MKKILGILLIAVIALGGYSLTKYNDLMRAEEDINSVWGNVESAYQRRADLIPNLVNTVKGQANFEKETLTAVIDARAKATAITINPNTASEEEMAKYQAAQQEVNSSLSRLLVSVEKYPELREDEIEYLTQLLGMELKILFLNINPREKENAIFHRNYGTCGTNPKPKTRKPKKPGI